LCCFGQAQYKVVSKKDEYAQEYLYNASKEEGALKQGQRYWARFALQQIQSKLCEVEMKHLLEGDNENTLSNIEVGALLLVGS
jgi:hypothetical protein